MIARMLRWLKRRLFAAEARLQLDTASSESGLAELLVQERTNKEEASAIAAAVAGIERGVPERELRVIHGNELYNKANAQFRHQKRITTIITEIGNECERQAKREGSAPRQELRSAVLEQARAAAAYAAAGPLTGSKERTLPRDVLWPWPAQEFRPHDARRNLVIAGAHVIAAIERLDRVAARDAANAAPQRRDVDENRDAELDSAGPPPLLFVRNHGLQPQHVIQGLAWLTHQRASILHIVANNPENLFDVFKKMSTLHRDEQLATMFVDLAHGTNVEGNAGEIQPIIISQQFDPIDPKSPLLLLYPSLETLEILGEEHGRVEAPWFIIPWDWEELAGWLEDHEAEEIVFD